MEPEVIVPVYRDGDVVLDIVQLRFPKSGLDYSKKGLRCIKRPWGSFQPIWFIVGFVFNGLALFRFFVGIENLVKGENTVLVRFDDAGLNSDHRNCVTQDLNHVKEAASNTFSNQHWKVLSLRPFPLLTSPILDRSNDVRFICLTEHYFDF